MNLEELKILRSKEENKKKFYFLNKSSTIFNEIVEIFTKNYDVLEELNKFFK
jgi:nucleoside diphosphate kinase